MQPESPIPSKNNVTAGQSPIMLQLKQLLGAVLAGGIVQTQSVEPAVPASNPVASPPVVTSLLPENVVDDVLDYGDGLVEQSCVGATPTFDDRPEPVTAGVLET